MSHVPATDLSALVPIVTDRGTPTLDFLAKWQAVTHPTQFTVASLPDSARVGEWAYATDLRVFDGAGTQETASNGTGGLVSWNGDDWVIVGTNIVAAA